jgi:flagellar operon protein
MSKINELLIPQVGPGSTQQVDKNANTLKPGMKSEFAELIARDLRPEVSISTHAAKRLEERNIQFDGDEYLKLKEAMNRLKNKGGHDSLVITGKAAYVVDVDRNMVVTAVDKDNMGENVFTKIDSTIFMN